MLDSDVPGLPERPINIFLPRFFQVWLACIVLFRIYFSTYSYHWLNWHCNIIYLEPSSSFSSFFHFYLLKLCLPTRGWVFFEQFFQSPHATLRKLSLSSVNQYIMLMPTVSIECVINFLILLILNLVLVFMLIVVVYNIYDCRHYIYPWINIFKVYLFLLMILPRKCESWLVFYSKCV